MIQEKLYYLQRVIAVYRNPQGGLAGNQSGLQVCPISQEKLKYACLITALRSPVQ